MRKTTKKKLAVVLIVVPALYLLYAAFNNGTPYTAVATIVWLAGDYFLWSLTK